LNAGEYQVWMKQAFLIVEGALATELGTSARLCMTEDYVRGALVRGLLLSNPQQANRVERERAAWWSASPCIYDPAHVPTGRPLQHDVAVRPTNADSGMVCEVKWLTQAVASRVACDIWKLVLSRGTTAEGNALRTYLLLGGTSQEFSRAIQALRAVGFNLRWSAAGPGGQMPRPTVLSMAQSLSQSLSLNAWKDLAGWGGKTWHLRTSPAAWASMRASMRSRWFRTIPNGPSTVGWRLVLWELDHRAVKSTAQLQWAHYNQAVHRRC